MIKDCILIYVYCLRSSQSVPELLRAQLLVPLLMTNRLPWTKGYFEHMENCALTAMDRLPQHCFKDSRGLRNVALTGPYMHDGSVATLAEAVDLEMYARGGRDDRPPILTPAERDDLVAFLQAVTSDL